MRGRDHFSERQRICVGFSMDSIIGDDIVSSVRGTVQHIVQLAADPDAQEALMSMDGRYAWSTVMG